jgi:MtrB/PioB family decaheme-associated outer membrane protein
MTVLTTPQRLIRALLPVVLLIAISDISAQDEELMASRIVDTSGWLCSLCPYRYGWYGELDIGAGYVGDSSLKFGDYRGLEEEGGFVAIDGNAHYRDSEGHFLDLKLRNLTLDSRLLSVRGGQRGRYILELDYREIPKYRGYGTSSPFDGAGSQALTLPAGWQPANNTSGMTLLGSSLRPVELKTQRKMLDAVLKWKLDRNWSYEVQYEHQSKDGTQPFGAGVFLSNASHFPVPVDFSTDRLGLALAYRGKSTHLRLGFSGSEFDNGQKFLTWQNPFTPIPGTEVLRTSLAPDNSFYQFNLAGTWVPTPKLRLSGRAAWGRMEQDDPLLPYSTNPAFSDLPLPRLSADTRIDTGTLNLGGKLTARLSRRLDLTARLRRDERDNKTPVDIWEPVITDLVRRQPRPNRPYSFERNRASLSLRYRAHGAVRLQVGADYEEFERSLQSVLETDEDRYWAEVSLSPGSLLQFRAKFEQANRDAGPYLQLEDGGPIEHPLMRKFHLADRDRDRVTLDIDLTPLPDLAFSLSYYRSEDDYERSPIGLQESEERNISLDANWHISERVDAHAFISQDDIDSSLMSAASNAASPWQGVSNDRFLTVGLGLSATLNSRLSLGFDFVNADSEGDIRTDTGAGEAPFPELQTDLRNVRLHIDYRANERWGLKFYLEREEYDSRDWALDGIGPDGIAAILSFGALSPDYSVTVVRAQASYRF